MIIASGIIFHGSALRLNKQFIYRISFNKHRASDKRHCVKSVQIRSFSGRYFPAFGLEKTAYLDFFHVVRLLLISAAPFHTHIRISATFQ